MIDIGKMKFIDLLPESIKHDKRITATAQALDDELQEINSAINKLALVKTIDDQPEKIVDELAWQRHVDFYDKDLPLETKRELVKKSKIFHKQKGTPSGVENLISIVFGDGRVEEWFEYGGEPYMFRVKTSNPDATNEKAVEFARAVNTVKNMRSWLEAIIIDQSENINLFFAGIVHTGDFITLKQVI